jgi:hypothetical protein
MGVCASAQENNKDLWAIDCVQGAQADRLHTQSYAGWQLNGNGNRDTENTSWHGGVEDQEDTEIEVVIDGKLELFANLRQRDSETTAQRRSTFPVLNSPPPSFRRVRNNKRREITPYYSDSCTSSDLAEILEHYAPSPTSRCAPVRTRSNTIFHQE